MLATSGNLDVKIGLIDGPIDFDHPDFVGSRFRSIRESQLAACKTASSVACMHGTFVAGILSGRRGGSAPAICPSCEIVLRPVFVEEASERSFPTSTSKELSNAIIETVNAGARIINLSLGLSGSSLTVHPELERAFNYARQHDVIVVAAAGNQASIGYVPHLNHSWIIPVVACDELGRISPESNIGPSIGNRGLMAPGVNITSTSPGGRYAQMSGTSVATPFVTGAIALLWSEFPKATAVEIKHFLTVATVHRRRTIIPPMLNAEAAWNSLKSFHQQFNRRKIMMVNEQRPGEVTQLPQEPVESTAVPQVQDKSFLPGNALPQVSRSAKMQTAGTALGQVGTGGSCPTCGGGNPNGTESQSFVYASGTIETRFPTIGVEKEFAQAMKEGGTANLTDKQVIYNVLKENRYLAHEICWVFSIENIATYILVPADPFVLDQLIEAIKPVPRDMDVDIIIGTRGPIAPVEMCNGLQVPLVVVDRIYSFDKPAFVKEIPKPKDVEEKGFRAAAEELFDKIQQLADNSGAMDEHRALNYCAARYAQIYAKTAEMHARDCSLSGVEVVPSRLSGNAGRKIVDVVFSYVDRKTDVVEKFYVRVDVTEKYPFLVSKLAPFYDR